MQDTDYLISSPIQPVLDRLIFSEPRPISTRAGERIIRTASIDGAVKGAFWDSYNKNKAEWLAKGYQVSKYGGGWQVVQWLNTDGTVTRQSREAAQQELIADKDLKPADWIPDDVTLETEVSNKLFDYQKPAVLRLKRALQHGNALDASDTGCHAKGTPILMYDGTIKAVENVEVGDLVMGWDGTPRHVFTLARGREQMARIVPTKGDPFVVNVSHILSLIQTNTHSSRSTFSTNGQVLDVRVSEWLAWHQGRKHIHKLFRVAVDCWPEKEFALSPYSLGVLLGDGCMTTKAALSITKPGQEMLVEAQRIAARFGCRLTTRGDMFNPTHHFAENVTLWSELLALGIAGLDSGTKFVPLEYKTASRDQRLEVLAGLLDTDGHMTSGGFDFISKSETLSRDVAFLARSLGLAAYVKQCEKGCQTGAVGTYHRVTISGDCSIVPCRLLRKQAPARNQIKDVLRTGFTVELLPEDDFYGFSLSGDGRFCLGDFTVTHNTGKTFCALVAAAELDMTPCVIAPLAVLPSWQRAASFLGVRIGFCINYEKLRNGKSGIGRFQMNEVFTFDYLPGKRPLLIFDEVQKAKSPDTKNGAILRSAAQANLKVLCLSATAAKDPTEMRNLGAALGLHDGTMLGWKNWCMANGCYSSNYGMKFNAKNRKMLDKIHRQIFPLKGNRIRVADLPEFPETQILAEALDTGCTGDITAAYDEMDSTLARLEADTGMDGRSKAAQGLAAIMKARKAAEKGKIPLFIELAQAALEEDRSPVIFLNFRAHCAEIAEAMKTKCIIWGSDMNGRAQKPEERQAHIDDFNADRARVCVISLQAGGAGLSLHDLNGNYARMSLISCSYSCIDLKQALGRIHRAGALTKSFQRIIFAAGVEIEEAICKSITEKLSNIDRLNDGHLAPPSILRHVAAQMGGNASLLKAD